MGKTIRKEKELSKEEKKRLEQFDKVCKELEDKKYERHDFLVSIEKANTTAALLPLPFVIIFVILYLLLGNKLVYDDFSNNLIWFIILSFISLFIHEGLHGITHAIFAKNHFKDVSFGFVLSKITPYCTCRACEKKYQYIIAC